MQWNNEWNAASDSNCEYLFQFKCLIDLLCRTLAPERISNNSLQRYTYIYIPFCKILKKQRSSIQCNINTLALSVGINFSLIIE